MSNNECGYFRISLCAKNVYFAYPFRNVDASIEWGLVHQSIFCCSSHSSDTCPIQSSTSPNISLVLFCFFDLSPCLLVLIYPAFGVFLYVRNNFSFALLIRKNASKSIRHNSECDMPGCIRPTATPDVYVLPGSVIFFPINAPGMGRFQLLNLGVLGFGLELRFWVVIAIIVSLTLTITLFTTLTII